MNCDLSKINPELSWPNSEYLNSKQAFILEENFAARISQSIFWIKGLRFFYVFVFINIAKYEVCTPLSSNLFAKKGHESQTRALQASLAPSAFAQILEGKMPTGTTLRHGQSLLCPHCPLKLCPDYICLPFNLARKGILSLGNVEIVVLIVLSVGLSCAL